LTQNQRIRAELLFTNYPLYIKYKHTLSLEIFMKKHQENLQRKIVNWIEKTKLLEMTVLIPQQTV
jgi:hypothetical protein